MRRDTSTSRFEAFYQHAWHDSARLAAALVGRSDVGEEVAQEAFIKVREKYDDLENPDAYLRRTVTRLAINALKSEGRRKARELRAERLTRADVSIKRQMASPELREALLAVGATAPRQRAAIVLRFWGDYSDAQIAGYIGCRTSTVRSLIRRGLNAMRSHLYEQQKQRGD